jgi:hypothetical protein
MNFDANDFGGVPHAVCLVSGDGSTIVTRTSLTILKPGTWYPAGMKVDRFDYPGGGEVFQFLDAKGDFQFQVTAMPYSQLDVVLDRTGDPSNASDQPDHLEIVDVVRDDTFTVLFYKKGIRYAVVTMPELEPRLTDILTTWRFLD